MTEICNWIAQSGHFNVLCICGTFMALAVLWALRDRITGISVSRQDGFRLITGDADLILDLHGKLDPIDHYCMTQIAEHTELMELLPVTKQSTLRTAFINQLANETLRVSAYANHHARELQSDYIAYCEKRLIRIHSRIHRFLWLLKGEKPDAEIIARYLERWLLLVVMPPVLDACKKKVAYYDSLLMLRKNISVSLQHSIQGWRDKNSKYIETLTALTTKLQEGPELLFGIDFSWKRSGIYSNDRLLATGHNQGRIDNG